MRERFGYQNSMAVPKVLKVVLNVGIPSGSKAEHKETTVRETLRMITGQEPVARKAKKSISNFKIRKGQLIGYMVTLRGPRMYDFLERLTRLTFARVRDFRGLNPDSFDGGGNFTVGFREAVAFPEVQAGDMTRQHGLEVIVVTTAKNQDEGLALLKLMGFPFKKDKN